MKICDLHCDTASELLRKRCALAENKLAVDLKRLGGYESSVQVFAVWTPPHLFGGMRTRHTLRVIENFKKEIEKNSDKIALVTDAAGLDNALAAGKTAAILGIEGCGALNGRMENLDRFYALGVRVLGLTWNGKNELACGVPKTGGLTDFGRAVLREAERRGMIVDLSHASERTTRETLDCYGGAVMASHSDAAEVCPHMRNLSPELRIAIAQRGGVVGLNLYTPFIGAPTEEQVLRHLRAMLKAAPQGVALGCDLDGCDSMPMGITDVTGIMKVYELIKREFSEAAADDVFFNNAVSFFRKYLR